MSHWTGENAVRAPYPEAPGKASGAADIVGERRRMLKKAGALRRGQRTGGHIAARGEPEAKTPWRRV